MNEEQSRKPVHRFKIGDNPNDPHPHTVALRALIHSLISREQLTTGMANSYLAHLELIDALLRAYEAK